MLCPVSHIIRILGFDFEAEGGVGYKTANRCCSIQLLRYNHVIFGRTWLIFMRYGQK